MEIKDLANIMQHEANITAETLKNFPYNPNSDSNRDLRLMYIQKALIENFDEGFSEFKKEYPPIYKEALKQALEGEKGGIEGERKGRQLLLQKYRESLKEDFIENHVKIIENEIFGFKGKNFCLDLPNKGNIKYFVVEETAYYSEETRNRQEKSKNLRSELGEEIFNRLENMIFTKEELLEIYNFILNYLNINGAEFRFSLKSIDDLKKEDNEIGEFRSIVNEIIPIPDFSIYGVGNDTCPKFISNYKGTDGHSFPLYPGDYKFGGYVKSDFGSILLKQ